MFMVRKASKIILIEGKNVTKCAVDNLEGEFDCSDVKNEVVKGSKNPIFFYLFKEFLTLRSNYLKECRNT